MDRTAHISKVKQSIQSKYPYLSQAEVDELFDTAETIYLELRFPFDSSIVQIPDSEPRAYTIVGLIAKDIAEKNGFSSVVAYSENGMSIKYDSAGVSGHIKGMIIANAGVVR